MLTYVIIVFMMLKSGRSGCTVMSYKEVARRWLFLVVWAITLVPPGWADSGHGGGDLAADLGSLEGTFRWDSELRRYVFDNPEGIENIVPNASRATIYALANCMDRPERSRVMLNSKPVSMGFLCYTALTTLIYYEPTTRNGDLAGKWAGYPPPSASLSELKAAKKVWLRVIKRREYTAL